MRTSRFFLAAALAPLLAFGALAAHSQEAKDHKDHAHTDKEVQADIQRHRAMAAAHDTAAQCLASGKGHEQCMKDLQAACKGLAIGKYCGMKHQH